MCQNRSGRKPDDIPSAPHQQYKEKGWINYGDWLGTFTIADRNRKFRPFNEAREYAESLNLSNVREWEQYCNSGKIPADNNSIFIIFRSRHKIPCIR